MYPDYDRKNNTSPKVATLIVVAMGIMALLTPSYLLSAVPEAFATKSDNDDRHSDKKHDDSKDDNGSEIPPAYIAIDGELSELQLENGPSGDDDSIADYDRDPQGTLSFGEHFSLLVPQGSGVLNVESAQLSVNDDVANQNDYLQTDIELVDSGDDRYLYFQTYLNDVPGGGDPDALGDGYTANENGFEIFLWWTVSFTDGTDQTYLAIVHLQGDECEEHGWDDGSDTTCVDFDA
ncbi:MAG TPA: hypothetical protein VKA09_15605 [Nitrososphaeraceae archaeon]|jgi:hypothetical protein|nr:hypothetical protein [Nitrososphaeraceae archaeon]